MGLGGLIQKYFSKHIAIVTCLRSINLMNPPKTMQQSVLEPGFLILSVLPRRLSWVPWAPPQRLLSACGLEAACRCAKNPGLNSGGPGPVPFPFFYLLSWSIGLCKESRAQKPNSHFCSLTCLPYLLLTNRTRRERERDLTKTDPGTLKTVSTGLTLRRGGATLESTQQPAPQIATHAS